MKTRTTLFLLGLVLALGLWIKLYESQGPNTEEAKRLAGSVLDFERENLEGIEIQNGEETIVLRRREGKWRLDAPIDDQADVPAVQTLISDLESWQKDETISADEIRADKARLTEYDLVKPKLRLKLLGPKMPPEILFGKDAALEGRMYVRFENAREVFLVRQTVKNDIAKKPEDFRDRKLTEIATAQVARLVLKTAVGEMEVQKSGADWEIVKPLRARADNEKIGDLIAQITSARIEQFVADDGGDLQPYGLAEPRGSITLFTGDEKEGRTLQIGAVPEKQAEQVYVRFSARSFVYTLPKAIESILSATPTELRDRHLVRIDTNMLDRITIEAPGKTKTVLARKNQSWTIANLNNQPANGAEVERFLETLQSEQVTNFVADVASDLAKYGLDRPQLQLTLSSFASENTAESPAGEQPLATIAFGRTEGEEVFARMGDEPFIVAVRHEVLPDLPADPVQWQEVGVFSFKPEEVQRLSITLEQETALTRGANGEWNAAAGDTPIDQATVGAVLKTLAKLRAVRWIGGETPAQAFEKMQIVIRLATTPDDKTSQQLTVGSAAGGGMWYARVEGRPGVFVLSNPDFNALRQSLTVEATPAPSPSPSLTAAPQ